MFGVAGEDGTKDMSLKTEEQVSTTTIPKSVWDVNDWDIDNDSGGGSGNQYAPAGFDPGYWVGATGLDVNGLTDASWATDGNWASGTAPVSNDKVLFMTPQMILIFPQTSLLQILP